VRELLGALQLAKHAARAAGRELVRPEDLPAEAGMPVGEEPTPGRAALDKDAVVAALAQAGGVVSTAARALGLHRTQLYRLMDKHGIGRDDG
jgi:transcriptional regulator of acetoin/glycerol metabolism